jgi:hypothetical protein
MNGGQGFLTTNTHDEGGDVTFCVDEMVADANAQD